MFIAHLPIGYLASPLLNKWQSRQVAYSRLLLCGLSGALSLLLMQTLISQMFYLLVPYVGVVLISVLCLVNRFREKCAIQAFFFAFGGVLQLLLISLYADVAYTAQSPFVKLLVQIELCLLTIAVITSCIRNRKNLVHSSVLAIVMAAILLTIALLETGSAKVDSDSAYTSDELVTAIQQHYPEYALVTMHRYAFSNSVDVTLSGADGKPFYVYLDATNGQTLEASHATLWRQQLRGMRALPPRYPEVISTILLLVYAGGCVLLYRRRRRISTAQQVKLQADSEQWLIAYASQSGQAEQLARRSAEQFEAAGYACTCVPLNALQASDITRVSQALFVVSTYGEGEAPDNAKLFVQKVMRQQLALPQLQFAVLALGDRSYPNFCGFSQQLSGWLRHCGAHPVLDTVEVDKLDPGAIRHWQQQLSTLTGHSAFSDWSPAHYRPWCLYKREHVNPGSQGAGVYHLVLTPLTEHDGWRAGDVAEIMPGNDPAHIAEFLQQRSLDGEQLVTAGNNIQTLAQVLCHHRIPAPQELQEATLDELLAKLSPLPHREYSIASLPDSGGLELVVRQVANEGGQLGLGSGWLSQHASLGTKIDVRIRHNTTFHLPDENRPLILIGNGTGIASLMALLKEREQRGETDNWLLFGERNVAHDFLFRDQLQDWLNRGQLKRLDLAFSRDSIQPVYVQHRLLEAATVVREWILDGAAIYVCGSLDGMGQDVHAALLGILGADTLTQLVQEHRYRRDLY